MYIIVIYFINKTLIVSALICSFNYILKLSILLAIDLYKSLLIFKCFARFEMG